MRRGTWGLVGVIAVVAWCLLPAAASAQSTRYLKPMTARVIDCPAAEIQIRDQRGNFTHRYWTATCHNRSYECSIADAILKCEPFGSAHRTAVPEPPRAEVQRGFDEKVQKSFVRGRFISHSGVRVTLTGAPSISLGKIVVSVHGLLEKCEKIEVLVNARPTGTLAVRSKATGASFGVEGDFDFATFKPLAQRLPSFGVRACGKVYGFDVEQLTQLRNFFVIYSELAGEVQQPEPEAPPTTKL